MNRKRNSVEKPVDVEDLLQKDYHRFTFEDLMEFGDFVLSEERLKRRFAERVSQEDFVSLKDVHKVDIRDITEFFNQKRRKE